MRIQSLPSTLDASDQLSVRRVASTARLPAITWLSSSHGQFTCPEGHPDCWLYLDCAAKTLSDHILSLHNRLQFRGGVL